MQARGQSKKPQVSVIPYMAQVTATDQLIRGLDTPKQGFVPANPNELIRSSVTIERTVSAKPKIHIFYRNFKISIIGCFVIHNLYINVQLKICKYENRKIQLKFDFEVQKINFQLNKLRQNSEKYFMSSIKTIRCFLTDVLVKTNLKSKMTTFQFLT